MATLPALRTFLDSFAGAKKLTLSGAVRGFDGDSHPLTLNARAAATVLAGEESGFDDTRHAALGFLSDLPLFVDTSKPALPVKLLADGAVVAVAPSLAAFSKRVMRGARAPKEAPAVARGPTKVVPGRVPAPWPQGEVLVLRGGDEGEDFLRFALKANRALYHSYVRKGRTVGARWKREKLKYDRGTGRWLDVARLDLEPFSIVTPRVKAALEALQPSGLEFLPLVGDVRGAVGDVYLVNPTVLVPCLDRDASGLPSPSDAEESLTPHALVVRSSAVPKEPRLFRPQEFPAVVLATGALVEALRGSGFSGLSFVEPSQWRP